MFVRGQECVDVELPQVESILQSFWSIKGNRASRCARGNLGGDASLSSQKQPFARGGANKAARELLKKRWENERLHLVSGKALLSRLSAWAQQEYTVSIGAMGLARAFRTAEIPQEMAGIITSIEEGTPFSDINAR
jgi:hypothetical protein